MKRFLMVFALILLLFGCDNRTTDPEDILCVMFSHRMQCPQVCMKWILII